MSQPTSGDTDPNDSVSGHVVPGYATPAGTHRYCQRFPNFAPQHFRQTIADDDCANDDCTNGDHALWVSSVGIGSYLGGLDAESSARLIYSTQLALRSGCNVIDTARNYRHTQSERDIGQAVAALLNDTDSDFQRDEFVICSKGGYLLQGDVGANADQPFTDQIVHGDHCMAPAFLADQITRSLANLQLETIDIYYLQNPEVQLDAVAPDNFEQRLRAAFVQLENEVANGRIRAYGIATWDGLRVPASHPRHLSLAKVVDLAREAGGVNHHLRAIQFPYNLGMIEALVDQNQRAANGEKHVSLLDAAAEQGLLAIGSMGLMQGQLARQLPAALKAVVANTQSTGRPETDAQIALQINRSTPGLLTTLVGMQSYLHVQENLQIGLVDPLSQAEFLGLFGG